MRTMFTLNHRLLYEQLAALTVSSSPHTGSVCGAGLSMSIVLAGALSLFLWWRLREYLTEIVPHNRW
jgi:hypothetical protein